MLKGLVCVAAVVAAAAGIAACGGDDGPTEEEFIADVTRACDAASADLAGVQSEIERAAAGAVDELGDAEERIEGVVRERVVPAYESLVSDLETITPPEDQQESFDELVSNGREQVELISNNPQAIFDETSEDAQRAQELSDQNDRIAAELGLPEDCGEPPAGTTGATGATGADGSD